jgi:ribosomal protein L16 Arg81 hydroxylase
MDLQTLLGPRPLAAFLAEYWHRLPYSAAGQAAALCSLATGDVLERLVPQVSADVLICRRNERYTGPPPRTADAIRQLTDAGYTLLVRHAERYDERLAAVAAAFPRDLAGPVNIHLYCTPPGEFGFGWHYDAEEVFIVQTVGHKEYSLRKNTVNPWPLEETLPEDMRYEREIMPLMRCELAAGDWLYIPSGYWHRGDARELAISLAIGVQPTTGVDLLDFLRRRALDSLLWRQRLPVAGGGDEAGDQVAALAPILQELARDLERQMRDPQAIAQFMAEMRARAQSE